jgi:hypothetical protein
MKKCLFTLLFVTLSWVTFAQTQNIRGRIIDQQSQYPLIGASVYIPDSEPLIGGSTDAEGYFVLQNVPVGRVALKITYLGYKEQYLPNVLVTSGKEVVLNVSLEEQIIKTDEVVITAEKDKTQLNNEFATISSRGFSVEETARYAGSRNDPARMASNFAGVSGANDARNDIIIRGNSPSGLLWRFEGIDIPTPNHFGTLGTTGGPVGMLNNNVLANSDFMTGAFPAEYGNANAGVFDLQMRKGNGNKREHLFQIGFGGVEAGAEGPFSKKSSASYLINYRYSTLGVFNALGIPIGTGDAVPQYQDISMKIDIPTQKAGKFTLFGLGGISSIQLHGSKQENPEEDVYGDIYSDQDFKSGTGVGGLKHTYFFNEKTYSEFTFAASGFYSDFKNDSLTRADDENRTILDRTFNRRQVFKQWKYSFHEQINKKFNAKNNLRIGLMADIMNVNLTDSSLVYPTPNDFQIERNHKGSATLLQAYTSWQHRFNDKLTLNTGLHYQYFLLNNTSTIEPRAGLKYNINNTQSLNVGFGMHSQLQPLQTYYQDTELESGTRIRTNKDLDFTKSMHFVVGYDNAFSDNMRFKVEAYYQNITNAPVERRSSSFSMLNNGADFGFPEVDSLVNDGTGYNYGLELTLEKFYSRGYYFLFTTSLFDSKYKGSDEVERHTAFNGNYVVNFLLGKEFKVRSKNAFFIDTKFTIAGGRRITPVNLSASIDKGYEVRYDEQAFTDQLAAYLRWDVKVGYRINGKKVLQEFFVDVQNVTNQDNVLRRQFDVYKSQVKDVYQLGLFPVVQYKLQF